MNRTHPPGQRKNREENADFCRRVALGFVIRISLILICQIMRRNRLLFTAMSIYDMLFRSRMEPVAHRASFAGSQADRQLPGSTRIPVQLPRDPLPGFLDFGVRIKGISFEELAAATNFDLFGVAIA